MLNYLDAMLPAKVILESCCNSRDLQSFPTRRSSDLAYTSTAANLTAIETSLDFSQADAATRGVLPTLVKVGTDTAGGVCLESDSKSGSKFYLVDITAGTQAGTWYGKNATCPADDSAAPTGFSKDATTGCK